MTRAIFRRTTLRDKKRNIQVRFAAVSAAALGTFSSGTKAQGLVERVIAHVPTSVTSLAMNDSGWVTWTTGRASGSQVYLWNRSAVVSLGMANGNNRDAQMNNNNWVVWDGNSAINSNTDAFVWRGAGVYADVSGAYPNAVYPVVNNLNDMAWGGLGVGSNAGIYDIYYISHTGTTISNLTVLDNTGGSTNPMLNDGGALTWTRQTDNATGGASNLVRASVTAANSFTSVTNSADLNVYQGFRGVNNSGVIVWRQYNDAKSKWDVWKYTPSGASGTLTDLSANLTGSSYDPYISNSGITAWHTDNANSTASVLYWDKNDGAGAVKIPLAQAHVFNKPVSINTAGSVAYVSGDGSGTGFDIILAEALPARTISGIITIDGVPDLQQPITFTFRPAVGASFDKTVTISASGAFTLSNIPAQIYTAHIKGALCLARNIMVDATSGDVSNANATLEPGDSNNDNSVDSSDFGALIGSFNTSAAVPGSGYDPTADFNFDGLIDSSDFALLIGSFNQTGDN